MGAQRARRPGRGRVCARARARCASGRARAAAADAAAVGGRRGRGRRGRRRGGQQGAGGAAAGGRRRGAGGGPAARAPAACRVQAPQTAAADGHRPCAGAWLAQPRQASLSRPPRKLSLRFPKPSRTPSNPPPKPPRPQAQGYVRHVSAKGLFVCLDRARDARVKLSALSDGFLEDPAAAFPEGALVRGRVVAAGGGGGGGAEGRVEMSLRSGGGGGGAGWRQLADIEEGELTTGKVRGGGGLVLSCFGLSCLVLPWLDLAWGVAWGLSWVGLGCWHSTRPCS